MAEISRRNAVILGGAGIAGIAMGATGLFLTQRESAPSSSGTQSGSPLIEPTELRSTNGALAVDLTSSPKRVTLAGREVNALSYNGGVPGPTLRVHAGDTLSVALHNDLTEPSNLHVHGLHVSPEDNSDNMFVTVAAGESFDYRYEIPANHPPGVYWYHPHLHGFVADQVFGGLYGAIIVEDTNPIPAATERVLVISDISVTAAGNVPTANPLETMSGREGDLVLVNGQLKPHLTARPGERERWRIVNACVSRYVRLSIDGQNLTLLGIDSGRFESAKQVDEVVLAPGNRADLLVTTTAGAAELRALPYDRGTSSGMMMGGRGTQTNDEIVLATLTVTGDVVETTPSLPLQPPERDLRTATVAARRELVFAMEMGGGLGRGMMSPTINGRAFDSSRVDTTTQFGTVEEWLLTNTSTQDHPLHLHVWPMQIVEQDGRAVESLLWQDVVNIPARSSTRVRIAFDDFSGRTVYHCHILDHEDDGMMGIIKAA